MRRSLKISAIQTVQDCFSAVERLGYRQWADGVPKKSCDFLGCRCNAEPTYITGTQIMVRIDSRAGTADYSLAKPKVGASKRKITMYCLNCRSI